MLNRRGYFGLSLATLLGVGAGASEGDDLKALAQRRKDLARRQLDEIERAIANPPLVAEPQGPKAPIRIEELVTWSRRVAEADRDLAADPKEDRPFRDHIDRMKSWREPLLKLVRQKSYGLTQQDVDALEFFQVEAESIAIQARR